MFFAWLIGFGGFTLLVDPYDIMPLVSIEGVNERNRGRTRTGIAYASATAC